MILKLLAEEMAKLKGEIAAGAMKDREARPHASQRA